MGRTFYLYFIDDEKPHDSSKVCLQWSYEPSSRERQSALYMAFTGTEMYDDRRNRRNDVQQVLDDPKNKARVCPRCSWFASRYNATDFFIDELNVHHSYSNPVLQSDFYFQNLYLGEPDQKYDSTSCPVRVLDDVSEVQSALETVAGLGKPLISKDLEAYEETVGILTKMLEFFRTAPEKGIRKPVVVYEGEF